MAEKTKIQYIHFYTDGSAARKFELVQPQKEQPAAIPQQKPRRRPVVYVDPLALCSIAVSVVMLVLMVVGMVQLNAVQQQEAAMSDYVQKLYAENQLLQDTYEEGVDLEQIEQDALALGMVPVDQVEHITIRVEAPAAEPEAQPQGWDAVLAFFSGLFA